MSASSVVISAGAVLVNFGCVAWFETHPSSDSDTTPVTLCPRIDMIVCSYGVRLHRLPGEVLELGVH